jgi:hypothetical protein
VGFVAIAIAIACLMLFRNLAIPRLRLDLLDLLAVALDPAVTTHVGAGGAYGIAGYASTKAWFSQASNRLGHTSSWPVRGRSP